MYSFHFLNSLLSPDPSRGPIESEDFVRGPQARVGAQRPFARQPGRQQAVPRRRSAHVAAAWPALGAASLARAPREARHAPQAVHGGRTAQRGGRAALRHLL